MPAMHVYIKEEVQSPPAHKKNSPAVLFDIVADDPQEVLGRSL